MPNVMGREFPYTPQGMAEAEQYRQAVGMRGGGMMGFRPVGYADAGVVSLAQNDFKAFLNPPDDRPPPNELEVNNYIYENMGDLQTAAQEDRNFGAYLDQIKARTGFETFFENVIAVNEQLEAPQADPPGVREMLGARRLGQEFGDSRISDYDARAMQDILAEAQRPGIYDYETQLLRERSAPYMMAEDERAAGTNAQGIQQNRELRELLDQINNEYPAGLPEDMPNLGRATGLPVGMNRGGIMSLREGGLANYGPGGGGVVNQLQELGGRAQEFASSVQNTIGGGGSQLGSLTQLGRPVALSYGGQGTGGTTVPRPSSVANLMQPPLRQQI